METNIRDGHQDLSTQHPIGIRFDHVSFAYNTGKPILNNVDFTLKLRVWCD